MEEIFKLKAEQAKIKTKLRLKKREMHTNYVKLHRKRLLFLDILVVAIILFNMGAVVTTGMLVLKNTPADVEITYIEIVPSSAERFDLQAPETKEQISTAKKILGMMLLQGIYWAVLTFCYLWSRWNITSEWDYMILLLFTLIMFFQLGYDFLHDLGLFLGDFMYNAQSKIRW